MNLIKIDDQEFLFDFDGSELSGVGQDELMCRIKLIDILNKETYYLGYIFQEKILEKLFIHDISRKEMNPAIREITLKLLINSLIESTSLIAMLAKNKFEKTGDYIFKASVPYYSVVYQMNPDKLFNYTDFINLLKLRLEFKIKNNNNILYKENFN